MERLLLSAVGFLIVISLIGQFTVYYHNEISSAAVFDAWATSGTTSLSLTVDGTPPVISIFNPQNKTYKMPFTTPLDIQVTDSSNISIVYYRVGNGTNNTLFLDSNGKNVTDLNIFLPGSYRVEVYAIDELSNLGTSNISFSLNYSISNYTINFSKFSYPGSTNFSMFNSSQLENISNLSFNVPGFGRINFNVPINLTQTNDPSDFIDLNSHILISSNFIFVNDTALIGLNQSANLTITNLTFSNPVIMRDGIECLSTICEKLSYTNGDLTFKIQHFSDYQAQEGSGGSDSGGSTGSSSSGGGGGGSEQISRNILGFLTQSKQVSVGLKGRVIFTISVNGFPYDHALTLLNIDRPNSIANVRIDSVNRLIDGLSIGASKEFDLSGDGNPDITLELISLSKNEAMLLFSPFLSKEPIPDKKIKNIKEKEDSLGEIHQEQPQKSEEQPVIKEEQKNAIYLIILMFFFMTAVVGWEYYGRKIKRRKNR